MKGRIFLGGLLGGVAMFAWGFVSHVVLGLSDRALQSIPPELEPTVIQSLQSALPGPGLYIYPTLGVRMDAKDQAALQRLDTALKSSVHGIITVAPPTGGLMPPRQMTFQLLGDVLAAVLAGIALALARIGSYGGRLFLVATMGLFAGLLVSLPHWNWYGFPTAYTVPEIADHVLRSLSAGLVLGAIVKPS